MAEKKEEKKAENPESTPQKEDTQAKKPQTGAEKKQDVPATKSHTGAEKKKDVPAAKPQTDAEQEKKDDPVKESKTDQEPEEKESYLKDLMAISGHGGLFRFVSQGRNGIIVESLETGRRMQAFATMKISSLEDIAVYTEEEEIKLEEILAAIHKYENGQEAISPKSEADDLKDYFSAILPEYDRERVYVSDIKKILSWYNLLLKYDLLEIGKQTEKTAEKKKEDQKAKASSPESQAKKKSGTGEKKAATG